MRASKNATALGRILVPLDGTPQAEFALRQAEQLCRHDSDGEPDLLLFAPMAGYRRPEVSLHTETPVESARRYLARHAERLQQAGIPSVMRIGTGDDAPTAILQAARMDEATLIVTPVRPHSALRRWLAGDAARTLVSRSPVPVLLCGWGMTRPSVFSHVLFPVTSVDSSPTSIGDLVEWIRLFRSRVTLVHIGKINRPKGLVPESSEEGLDEVQKEFAGAAVSVDRRLTRGSPTRQIPKLAREIDADLIVVPADRATGVARRSTAPVLMIPPRTKHDPEGVSP